MNAGARAASRSAPEAGSSAERTMRVAIAGGHGKIAMRLAPLLRERGDEIRSLVRNPAHAADVTAAGADPVVCDLEAASTEQVAAAIDGADAVVFAAGAGPGSGPERKETMDHGGAVKLMDAAKANGIPRYVMISSMGADPNVPGEDTFSVYLRAKGRADAALMSSGLDYAIARPGRLTDDPGTGRVRLGERVDRGEISRDDVAAVLAAVLHEPRVARVAFELVAGEDPIDAAVAALAARGAE
jgi:uncharacterized protein YbjT (DUF2867 family)